MIETDVSASIRIEGAKRGVVLMRNNSGAFEAAGRWVRFGLGNDSEALNRVMKSSDLIGLMSGWWWGHPAVSGLFIAVESKPTGWRYRGTDRETAQLAFINHVRRHGGVACFATHWSDVENEITAKFQARIDPENRARIREGERLSSVAM
jgi:hypothetical protein